VVVTKWNILGQRVFMSGELKQFTAMDEWRKHNTKGMWGRCYNHGYRFELKEDAALFILNPCHPCTTGSFTLLSDLLNDRRAGVVVRSSTDKSA
jgi:hypothetical protein